MTKFVKNASELPQPEGARCKRCHKLIREDGHAGYCSSDCMQAEGEEFSQGKLRALVLSRDAGVCAVCRLDTLAVRAELDDAKKMAEGSAPNDPRARQFWKSRVHSYVLMGFGREDLESDRALWDCDHIEPTAASGPSTLANARTLCRPHHQRVTGAFAAKRAALRKPRRSFGR